MNKKLIKGFKIGLPLLLASFFGWLTFSKLPFSEIIPYFKKANYLWVLTGMFIGLLSHISRAYRWQFMLKPLGYSIKLPNSFMALFAAYLANYGIPRSGEVLRAAVITNYEKVPFEQSFGTIVAERIIDLAVILIIVAITLFFQFDFIYSILLETFNLTKILFGLGILLVLGIAFLIFIQKSKLKIAIKIKNFLSGLIKGVTSIFKLKQKWTFLFHTIFIWCMYVLMFYITSFALEDLNQTPFAAIIVAFIAASFTIAATNGGLFFYPAAVLAAFLLFDLPKEPSYAFGWIVWASQTVMITIIGILSFICLPIYNKSKLN
ncbi:lysylphosphatidylglycerol synthase transmembrane domain-containing protein [Olleya namhaensis]|uniref:Lysylphosphatidylglycerol synthase TM region n=1 Tax=Olleya namhaensis TaxID=1144750 RepID=A0A1I3JP96_9FLAO|nr:lysylphosphatidylglycerol synthase transmembrane domain-containing protein [Olleya namhaensis]SFI61838.1 hypothetical protein SAMN05443431_101484 [Olleya namhaensis]